VITYCSNIHPGESWLETFQSLRIHIPAVKNIVSPNAPFPIGLRLSSRASEEVDEHASAWFARWLREQDLFVPTINGFPHGSFHRSPIKENVYLPDWRSPERVAYTRRLATLLDCWLPDSVLGSISTVPIGFGKCLSDDDLGCVRKNLCAVLECLDGLRQKSGKRIVLALEPEPSCFLETTDEVVAFFDRMSFSDELRQGIGICFDCCHQAVQFEDPVRSLGLLADSGILVPKVQVSSALRLKDPVRDVLTRFCEPCYLHQVVIRTQEGSLKRYVDLPEAFQGHASAEGDEWRIHYHVPIFAERVQSCDTTRFFIEELVPLLDKQTLLEVETYTWEVLPPELRMETVTGSIIREIQWLKGVRT
jgi:hypothetical protein